ncbi:MAG: hypothetical protein COB02_14365 [Candidatus Cloacimonadota bacterium]|nr:MAG: hypothetical protein COB02_14365 [Candidatus Cloacimonadota bacterium]
MAKVILSLKKNSEDGKQELTIDYESDGDALPFEHEEDHKALVKKLLGANSLDLSEIDSIVVNRKAIALTDEGEKEREQQSERKKIIQR